MARWIQQNWKERLTDGTDPRIETEWSLVTDTPNPASPYSIIQARTDLLAVLPTAQANLPLTSFDIDRLGSSDCFVANVVYSPRVVPEDGKFDFTADTRMETRRIFQAASTVGSYYPSTYNGAPNDNGFMRVNQDTQPDGLEISIPVKTFNVTCWWAASRFNIGQSANYQTLQAYKDLLETLEGTVNSSAFSFTAFGLTWSFAAGECLLASTRLSYQASGLWQIDIELRKKKNYVEPTLSALAGTSVIVEGWDEVDFRSRPYADNTAVALAAKTVGAYKKTTFPRANHNLLLVP